MDSLLELVGKAVRQQPEYRPDLCIAVKKSVGACSACRDVCPHEAITIGHRVVVDEIHCSGCGLCIEACPSEALSSSPRLRPDGAVRCSRVNGNAQSVECLGRLQATDLLRVASGHEKLTLARRDCAACPVGNADVVEAVERVVGEAAALAAFRPRPLAFEVVECAKLMREERHAAVSRRDLFRLGLKNVQAGASEALARVDFGGDLDSTLPDETQRRFAWLSQAKPATDAAVPWVLPRVAESCILCPVCTNVCPTRAFDRRVDPPEEGGVRLLLSPERCNGCSACVTSCPVHAITLDSEVTWGELSGGTQEAFLRPPPGAGPRVSPAPLPVDPGARTTS